MGETYTPGQGRSQFPSIFPEWRLWALSHMDSTEPQEAVDLCLWGSKPCRAEGAGILPEAFTGPGDPFTERTAGDLLLYGHRRKQTPR